MSINFKTVIQKIVDEYLEYDNKTNITTIKDGMVLLRENWEDFVNLIYKFDDVNPSIKSAIKLSAALIKFVVDLNESGDKKLIEYMKKNLHPPIINFLHTKQNK